MAILEAAVRAHAETLSERTDRTVYRGPWVTPPGVECQPLYIEASGESDDFLKGKGGPARLVSAARRHALEVRLSAIKKDLVEYDAEHAAVLRGVAKGRPDLVEGDLAAAGEHPRVSVRDFGHELRRGAEHLNRTLRIHLGASFKLIAAERSGDVRFRVYARPWVAERASRVQTGSVAAVHRGMMPSAGAIATALKFDTLTLCLVGLNVEPTGAALEEALAEDRGLSPPSSPKNSEATAADDDPGETKRKARRSSWAHSEASAGAAPTPRKVRVSRTACCWRSALANKLLAATLASLKIGDDRRGATEQFSHCVLFGQFGYGPPHSRDHEDPLLGEIHACRALTGFTCDASPRGGAAAASSSSRGSPTPFFEGPASSSSSSGAAPVRRAAAAAPFASADATRAKPVPLRVAWRRAGKG